MLVSRVKEKARPQTQMSLDRGVYGVGMMTLGLVSRAKLASSKTNLIVAVNPCSTRDIQPIQPIHGCQCMYFVSEWNY